MPRDTYGNEWRNPLQTAFWDSFISGDGQRPYRNREENDNNELYWDRIQPLAEEWAVREGRTELYCHFRNPPDQVPTSQSPPRAGWSYGGNSLVDPWECLEPLQMPNPPNLASGSPGVQYISPGPMDIRWDSITNTWRRSARNIHSPLTTPAPYQRWPNHERGPFGNTVVPGSIYPGRVHGWRFRTLEAANYYSRLMDLSDQDDETIINFRGMGASEQLRYIQRHPIPAQVEAMPQEVWDAPIRQNGGSWQMAIPNTEPQEWGWSISNRSQAQFGANMAYRDIGTNYSDHGAGDPLYLFACMSTRQRDDYMLIHPEEGAPLTQTETTMTPRDKNGKFRKKGESLKQMIQDLLSRAIPKPDKKGKKHDRDKIMAWASRKGLNTSLIKCGRMGTWHKRQETLVVSVSPNADAERWCVLAVNEQATCCGGTGHYYANDGGFTFVSVHGINRPVHLETAQANYHLWRDGAWHSHREPETPEMRQERIRNTGEIPGYHNIVPAWRNGEATAEPDKLLFGIELEIRSTNRRMICTEAEKIGWIGEQDGSLCRQTGLEVVAKPESFEEISDPKGKWKTFLNEIRGKCRGWDAGKHYGMHISVSRQAMDPKHQIRFICFFHDNVKLCEFIAGRGQNEYCKFYKKQKDSSALRPENKYEAACVRGAHRIEVRIFRSTVSEAGFMRNVEFTHSAVEFTRNPIKTRKGDAPKDYTHEEFESWLKTEDHKVRYPNLYEHMFLPDGKPRPAKSTKKDELPPLTQADLEAERQPIPATGDRTFHDLMQGLRPQPAVVFAESDEDEEEESHDEDEDGDCSF